MGLAFVELVMAVEERFDIKVPDEEVNARYDAGRMRTVGDLHAMVVDALRRREQALATPDACPTSAAFYRVRRALMKVAGTPRSSVRPATPVEDLIPREKRREEWERLFGEIGVYPPPLRMTVGAVTGARLALFVAGPTLIVAAFSWPGATPRVAALAFWPLVFLAICYAHAFSTDLPASCSTVGDVARHVARLQVGPPPAGVWTDEAVFEALKWVLVDQVRADPNEVTMGASLEEIGAID